MSKLCWKCGNPHEEGDRFCLKCGASFATEDERYQTDGRTISNVDDRAYLSAPPPKYKKSKVPLIIGFFVVIGVVAVAVLVFGSMQSPDVEYEDYDIEVYYSEDKDATGILYKMWIYNKTDHAIDTSKIWFTIDYNGMTYKQYGGDTMVLAAHDFAAHGYAFVLEGKVDIEKVSVRGHSDEYSIKHT